MAASESYIAQETAAQRQPVEIYHIWRGDVHFRHTSADLAVDYDGYTWAPATIQRGAVSLASDMKSSEVAVTFLKTDPAISAYIASTPMVLARIEIRKLFRDQDPLESQLVFMGEIVGVGIKGLAAQATCAGVEHILQNQLLQEYYQPECNHTAFDAGCGLSEASHAITPTVTVDASGTVLTASAFAGYDDGWFQLGKVLFDGDYRMITDHTGSTVTIQYKFADLETGDTVTVLPGCDGNVDTCRDKFANLNHFFGFPFIPIDNPAMWTNR